MTFLNPAKYEHGTRAKYVAAKCRCALCRAANTAYYHARRLRSLEQAAEVVPNGPPAEKVVRKRDRWGHVREFRFKICPGVNGVPCPRQADPRKGSPVCADCRERATVWNGYVSSKGARKHLRRLSAMGIGYKAVAAASDVAQRVLSEILAGRKKRIRAQTEKRILAVDDGARADKSLVDGARTMALLRDLRARGFTLRDLTRRLFGVASETTQIHGILALKSEHVTAATQAKVERFHRRVLAGEVTPNRPTVDAAETWKLISVLLRGFSAKALSRKLGYTVNAAQRSPRVFHETAAKVRRLYEEIATAHREGGPLPDGWQTSARPVTAIGAEVWAQGGWSVARRTSKAAKVREEKELRRLARRRKDAA